MDKIDTHENCPKVSGIPLSEFMKNPGLNLYRIVDHIVVFRTMKDEKKFRNVMHDLPIQTTVASTGPIPMYGGREGWFIGHDCLLEITKRGIRIDIILGRKELDMLYESKRRYGDSPPP